MTSGASAAHSSLTLATCLLCIAATILHIIAFSTPNWLVSDGSSPFVQLGFHEACFSNCFFPYCPGDPDIIYDRCYQWTFNEIIFSNDQFRDIVNWLMPGWFTACKNVFIINIPMTIICCILLIICVCWACASRYTPASPRKKDIASMTLLYITLVALIVSTLLNVTGIAIFSSNGPKRDYMPMAYKNHFGYSFWLDLAVCIILGVCCVTTYLAAIAKTIHFRGPKDPRYSEDMMLGRI